MRDTEDDDTPANELEATSAGIGEVTEEKGKSVDQHVERLVDSIGLDGTHAERTSGLLGALGRRTPTVTSGRKRAVDEVVDETDDTVVGSTLAELDGTDHVCDGGEGAGHTAEGSLLLLGGLALIVVVDG